ncbi:MAG: Tm-1-like ATP-binding domain-containing protein, partial [Roseiarcus sp.]
QAPAPSANSGPVRIYITNPVLPTRWSQPVPAARIEAAARTLSTGLTRIDEASRRRFSPPSVLSSGPPAVLVVGTLDTKGPELRFIRDLVKASGLRTRLVDVSTSGKPATADVTAQEIALNHGRGGSGVFGGERGASVTAMAEAFEGWVKRQPDIAGIIGAGGSGGASIIAPGMRALPIGVPKVLISSVASGDVGRYVGPADITMMYSVTDVQGLNSISRQVLGNGAQALIGMVKARLADSAPRADLPAVGLTMFGVTTPCVQQISAALANDWECLVFHATGVGGQSMEKLVDSGMITSVVDITTTEVADLLMGGVLPATEDRFGAVIRKRMPYVGSVGALDMVNFGARDNVPLAYKGRRLQVHNPQVTLMRTTPTENDAMGRWIGERLNRMDGPVRFFLPEGGVSALDAPGQPFHDPESDAALFRALDQTVRQTTNRQLIRIKRHINDPEFASAVVTAFRALNGRAGVRKRAAR